VRRGCERGANRSPRGGSKSGQLAGCDELSGEASMNSDLKIVVALMLVAIVASLGKALFHMTDGPDQSGQMARALTMRISLSVALFVLLFLAWHFGLIAPHNLAH
jgi:cytochrome bd-type quinol oxidase subunit 2